MTCRRKSSTDPSRGIIARYAWGDDYHEIIRPLLFELDAAIRKISGRTAHGKGLVDTGPVLERDWAMQAGLGFTGKNCCTIRPVTGSWLLLATLLVPEELTPDPNPTPANQIPLSSEAIAAGLPPQTNLGSWRLSDPAHAPRTTHHATCGSCTRCLTACPTDAFVGPLHLDPARCISYWTIEARSPIPRELRPHFGNRIFGCDICQEVCPWNRRLGERTPLMAGLRAQDERVAPFLLDGFAAGESVLVGSGRLQHPLPPLAHQAGQTGGDAAQRLRGLGELGRCGGHSGVVRGPGGPRCPWPASMRRGDWANS